MCNTAGHLEIGMMMFGQVLWPAEIRRTRSSRDNSGRIPPMNRFIVAVTAAMLMAMPVSAGVTEEDLANDQQTPGDILTNGMGRDLQRYSPLDMLNRDNVKNLVPVWAFSLGGEKQRGQETQPLIHDGVMYITGSYSRLYAIDLKTGKEIWQFDARLPEGILPCCDVVNRGAALFGDNIYFGTLDARIVALNAKTGDVVWNKKIAEYKEGYSYTAAPLIVNGLVVTGNSGGEFGILGEVQARDALTGELVWSRPTIEGNMGTFQGKESTMTGTLNATWPGDMYKNGGGATWLGGSYDADTNTLVFGAGNPAPWNSWLRNAGEKTDGSGDNLYAASRLGIDPANGEIKWHYQTTPREGWDFDGVNEVIGFVDKDGNKKYATADRNGFFYVLNREDGKFVDAWPFVKDITWASGIDDNGRPIYIEEGRPGNPAAAADGAKGEVVFAAPSFLGGKNWMPMAYSQKTGLFYVPSNEWGMDIWNEPITFKKGAAFLGAGFTIKPIYEDHIGSLKAIDPMTGEWKWEYKNDAPLWSGVMTTAGGLVFFGTPEGDFKALDDETGEELWSFQTGSGIVGQPVTWEQDGEQYVSIISGWGGAVPLWGGEVAKKVNYLNQGGLLWVFKLPKQLAMAN
jgi:alcohol dehydrogenase (cytochrome c)